MTLVHSLTDFSQCQLGISNAEEKQGQDSRELHNMIHKSNDGWAFRGGMLIYETTGAIFSNDELGEKHERTVLKTGSVRGRRYPERPRCLCLYQSLSLHTERSPLAAQQWNPFSRCRRSESTVTVLQNPLDKGCA